MSVDESVTANGNHEDLRFARAVLSRDPAAEAAFETRFIWPAQAVVRRVQSSPDFVSEACQELRRKLLVGPPPRLASYSGRGPLGAFVNVVAIRVAHGLVRTRPYRAAAPAGDEVLARLAAAAAIDPGLAALKEGLRGDFQEALSAAVAALSPRERNLLRMQLCEGFSIDQLAQPYRVHRATAARWCKDIRDRLAAQVKQRVAARHPGLSPSEWVSLARLVQSQLHISVARLEGGGGDGDGGLAAEAAVERADGSG